MFFRDGDMLMAGLVSSSMKGEGTQTELETMWRLWDPLSCTSLVQVRRGRAHLSEMTASNARKAMGKLLSHSIEGGGGELLLSVLSRLTFHAHSTHSRTIQTHSSTHLLSLHYSTSIMSRRTIDLTGVDRRLTLPPPSLRKTRHGDVHVYTDRPWRHEFFSQILNGTRGQRAGMSSEPERVSTWETGVRTWERVMQSMNELNIDATLGQSFLPSDIGDDEEVILKLSSGTELSLA